MEVRNTTKKLIKLVDNGSLDARNILVKLLKSLSESQVEKFVNANDLFNEDNWDFGTMVDKIHEIQNKVEGI